MTPPDLIRLLLGDVRVKSLDAWARAILTKHKNRPSGLTGARGVVSPLALSHLRHFANGEAGRVYAAATASYLSRFKRSIIAPSGGASTLLPRSASSRHAKWYASFNARKYCCAAGEYAHAVQGAEREICVLAVMAHGIYYCQSP